MGTARNSALNESMAQQLQQTPCGTHTSVTMLSVLSMSLQKVLDLDVHINHKHLSNTGSHIGRLQCLKVPLLQVFKASDGTIS